MSEKDLIREYKSEYSPAESRLFDAMMLGTVWKGRMNEVKEFRKKYGEPTSDKAKKEQEEKINDSRKTSLSKLGYASDAIPNSSVTSIILNFLKGFQRIVNHLLQKDIYRSFFQDGASFLIYFFSY